MTVDLPLNPVILSRDLHILYPAKANIVIVTGSSAAGVSKSARATDEPRHAAVYAIVAPLDPRCQVTRCKVADGSSPNMVL